MDPKKIGKSLLFPPLLLMILLIPIATVLLVYSMLVIGTESVIAIISYVISAYTLTVWCVKIPDIINFFKTLKAENKYAVMWFENAHLRINATLYAALIFNVIYGIFQLCLGFYHRTFWFYSLGSYYVCLVVMRLFLLLHTRKYAPGERMRSELIKYKACGWVFLVMNLALTVIVTFMIHFNRTFEHHMITTIAMAAYTFTAFTVAIVNVIRYKKYNSPVFSASKIIALVAALVSILTLESTMLNTFSDGTMTPIAQKWMLGATGGVISVLIVLAAIYMIVTGTKNLKLLETEVKKGKQ